MTYAVSTVFLSRVLSALMLGISLVSSDDVAIAIAFGNSMDGIKDFGDGKKC